MNDYVVVISQESKNEFINFECLLNLWLLCPPAKTGNKNKAKQPVSIDWLINTEDTMKGNHKILWINPSWEPTEKLKSKLFSRSIFWVSYISSMYNIIIAGNKYLLQGFF